MFSALSARMNVALFHLVIYAPKSAAVLPRLQALAFALSKLGFVLAAIPLAVTPPAANCADNVLSALITGLTALTNILTGLGVAAGVVGIAVGGLMRATSFGNERRIAMSNTAITCAVVGLVIVILSITIGNELPTWLGITSGTCNVDPGGTTTNP